MSAADPPRRPSIIAFGGNALIGAKDLGTLEEQWNRARQAARWMGDLVTAGHELVLVHGNGPQVGQVLIQMEEAVTKVPPATLDVAVAQTEGSMGYLLELALRNRFIELEKGPEVSTVLSLVVVDGTDPGFLDPTKPVGPFFSRYRAEVLRRDHGWQMVEDSGRGWRKVVPSPRPLEIVGLDAVRRLLAAGHLVIAGGGGGIPVVRREDGALQGVEAVIDKDYTAAMLGGELGAELLIILTDVPEVQVDFGKPEARPLRTLPISQARRLHDEGQFPPGSMGPKVRAAIDFVEAGGRRAVITDIEHLEASMNGAAGTTFLADSAAPAGAGELGASLADLEDPLH